MSNKPLAWAKTLAAYAVLALLMRFLSFFPSVINHDESTYILIADAIREGKIYLIDVIDTKPVGIFLLFGIFQTLFGKSIVVIRILTTLWIALTALGLHKVQEQLGGRGHAPFATGVMYIVMTSVYTHYGISPNTELFFNLFTIIALWLLLLPPKIHHFLLAGLCLGAGFIIKYVVLFDAIAFAVFFLWKAIKEKWIISKIVIFCIACVIGFAIPFTSVYAFYYSQHYAQQFLFYTFEVSGNYFIDQHWTKFAEFILQAFARFFFITFFFFYSLFGRSFYLNGFKFLIITWSLAVLYIIILPGKLFDHYFIQFMLPFALMAGSFFDERRQWDSWLKKIFTPRIGYPILIILMIANTLFYKKDYLDKPDYATQMAEYLDNKIQPKDKIYTGNYHQIIYHLLNKESLTHYIHRSLIWDQENANALEINQTKELFKILQQKPRFIIYQGKFLNSAFAAYVKKNYRPLKRFPEEIKIYERLSKK
ncbi:MAG: glycosyltransferase family 39 protein [Saprospiraceae bacterium]|nr:glycosyltransferase family 39 protein [Saprospiraceae bacterium]